MNYDIVVVGAGPAGGRAALFCAKAGKKTLIIDDGKSITKRAWVANHYGIEEISGEDLVEKGKQHAQKFGADIVPGKVVQIEKTPDGFNIHTEEDAHFQGKHVILATGVSVELAERIGVKTKEGTEPRIKHILELTPEGKTNIPGIWGAGTCAGVSVHTIITAGDGAKVAINLLSEINGERYVDHDMKK